LALRPPAAGSWRALLFAEPSALGAAAAGSGELRVALDRVRFVAPTVTAAEIGALPADVVAAVDPVGSVRHVVPGSSGPADAGGALAALDGALAAVQEGRAAALVTAPISKESIARHCRPGFRGHTDYLASACGCERYGRDYLMAFLTEDLQVALLTTHLPLEEALAAVSREAIVEALGCLARHAGGRIAVAGLNPHAGEGGLLGTEETAVVAPAIERARRDGIDAHGPESPDSLFARARRGAFDWVLALYHDQGLIAVKTAAFGQAVNWTLGLPIVRTSVDHGTAFAIAGQGRADAGPLGRAVVATLDLLAGRLPRGRAGSERT
jgi:4-hydroxythreonine-4-phosphate dehydrogenase